MLQQSEILYSLETLPEAAASLWASAQGYRIFAFNGQMGAGKTTLVHALCDFLGVQDAVSSPTFALINEYHFTANTVDHTIYHMDWYRLRDMDEAINAGLEDCLLQPDAYCFVEWPEKALPILPKPYVWIDIEILGPQERRMKLIVHDK